MPQQAGAWLLAAQNWAANTVGWYYMLAMTLYLVFVVVTALSGYGKIKLGADHDEPEFSYLSWAGMLFAAGISITLFFFCVSEPLTHMLQPPQGEAGTPRRRARRCRSCFCTGACTAGACSPSSAWRWPISPTAITCRWRCVRRCTR
jgi:choline-glycine betaine transporter